MIEESWFDWRVFFSHAASQDSISREWVQGHVDLTKLFRLIA